MIRFLTLLLTVFTMAGAALAQDAPMPTLNSGDTAWMLTSSALVLLMTLPGVALFYGGMVRKENVLATVMQSFAITCLVTILWVVAGYSMAFREGSPYLGGLDRMFLEGMKLGDLSGTIPESVFCMFQLTFAIITPALIMGAVADRMKFSAMMLFTAAWVLVVYVPIAHWVWGPGGFLGGTGLTDYAGFLGLGTVLDYAGGTVVHINSGIAGLVAAIMIGKRHGLGSERALPHNLVFSVIGGSLLWVGWFGFNAGSAVAAGDRAGMAMLVTHIATAVAGFSWMGAEWLLRGKPSVLGIISGAVAGLVAITPASGFVGPMGAIWIGLIAGVACYWATASLKKKLGYDDALDVFGVHGVGGIVGALLTGVFAMKDIGGVSGLLEGNPGQVIAQAASVAVTLVYSGVMTAVILTVLKSTIGIRVDQETEYTGLDLALHGEKVH